MRGFLAGGAVLALLQTVSIIGFAWFVSRLITGAIAGDGIAELAPTFWALAAMVALRAFTVWAMDATAAAGAARVKSQLRVAVLGAVRRLGPDWAARKGSATAATVIGPGLDALDGYFAKYLPQLVLTVVATPLLVLVVLLSDWVSALIVVIALPLIPIFMVLIGLATQAVQRKQWDSLQRLSGAFLDVVGGLSTLKIFGRERRQLGRIHRVTDEYRVETMKVLRLSFLSGFVLELAGSLSVALIAVTAGLRLLDGQLSLGVGLFVLILAPEIFLPLRNVGAQFHAAADGVAASEEIFEIIEAADALPARDTADAARAAVPRGAALRIDGLGIRRGDRLIVDDLSAGFEPGAVTVLTGQSGAGKSSIVAAIQGFLPYEGEIRLAAEGAGARAVSGSDIAWCGQTPGLAAGSVAENIALGSRLGADERGQLVQASLRRASASAIDPALELGVAGSGLSGGQAQRVAIARAFYRWTELGTPLLILDEPSSALDAATEAELIASLRAAAADGAIVIVVSHREAVIAAADRVVSLEAVRRA
ncbi:ATP-binding cassette subfamily C protein CydD [Microterricola gilva]|uniref:ATP-binding cassette subfamily C protein CydD n=2 Tax=Microterricola gilva TaxID=393267 RepID=A0A4V2GAS8_9MICO|nr:thiol reductant ABC exporter subunit CydD [Microterricola gilva]RZU65456.1 ATP-binding cassette subfamily C protein CydD [Microterricola gilva]